MLTGMLWMVRTGAACCELSPHLRAMADRL